MSDLTQFSLPGDKPRVSTQTNLCASTERSHGLVLDSLSAEETATLDERGLPKGLGRQYRRVQVASDGYNQDAHTVSMAVSSETPVARYYGEEILSHAKGALRTDRLKQGVALLFNHSMDQHLGRSVDFKLSDTGLQVTSRFGENPLALEKELDVRTGILVDVSIGYFVHAWDIVEDTKTGFRTYTATDWEIYEISLVTVPADPTVGVGRALAADEPPVKFNLRREGQVASNADAAATRSAEDDDEDEDDDEPGAEERAVAAAETSTPSSEPSTTNPEAQRTAMPPETTVVVDLVAEKANRSAALTALSTAHPKQFSSERLQQAIALDQEPATIRSMIFNQIVSEAKRSDVPTISEELFGDMGARDAGRYSLRSAYIAAAKESGVAIGGDTTQVREVSDELRKRAAAVGISNLSTGIIVPSATTRTNFTQMQERTVSSGGNAGQASNYTTVNPDPIELLRFKTVLLAMGAQMMTGLQGILQMIQQTGAAQSSWVAEQSSVANTDPTFGFFKMGPNRLDINNSYTRDFLAQSALAIDPVLANDRRIGLAISLDTAGLAGSGQAPVPLGVMNRTGLGQVLAGSTRAANGTVTAGVGGVPMTFVDYNNMEATISTNNADIGTMGIITTPRVRASGRTTPKTPGTATEYIWPTSPVGANGVQEGPLGYKAICTSNPVLTGFTANGVSGLHAVLMGVFDQILFGDWGLSELIVDPYSQKKNAVIEITERAFYDCNVRQLPSFCLCTSALPS